MKSKETQQKENEFIEYAARKNPKWVKEKRLNYLYSEIEKDMLEVIRLMKVYLACQDELYSWFGDNIRELMDKPRRDIAFHKKEIDIWNFEMEMEGEINEEDIASAHEIDCAQFVDVVRWEEKRSWALCPFHKEETPSFCCYKNKGYNCFGCGANGDAIDLIQKLYGYSFREAVKFLKNCG